MRRPPHSPRVLLTTLALALVAALPAALTAPEPAQARPQSPPRAPTGTTARLTRTADDLTLTVPPSRSAPGYRLQVTTGQLSFTTLRSGGTVLATASGDTGALRFRTAGTWHHATRVTGHAWKDGTLTLTADTTAPGATIEARVTPSADRYQLRWRVIGATPNGSAWPAICRPPVTGTAMERPRPRTAAPPPTSPGRWTAARSCTPPSARPPTT